MLFNPMATAATRGRRTARTPRDPKTAALLPQLLLMMMMVMMMLLLTTLASAAPTSAENPKDPKMENREWAAQSHHRVRRQNGEIVESIFQIPIQTLMAVSKAFTTGIQSVQRMREQFFQATGPRPDVSSSSALTSSTSNGYNGYQQYKPQKPYRPTRPTNSGAFSQAYAYAGLPANYVLYNYNRPRAGAVTAGVQQQQQQQSHAASVAGVHAQNDGSSYRI